MSNIKQISPITRIQPVIRDRNGTSQKKQKSYMEKNKEPKDMNKKDQANDPFHVDEYV